MATHIYNRKQLENQNMNINSVVVVCINNIPKSNIKIKPVSQML